MHQVRQNNLRSDDFELYERRCAYLHHMNNLSQIKSSIDTSSPDVAPRIRAYQQRAAAKRAAQFRLEEKNLRLLRQKERKAHVTKHDYFLALNDGKGSKYNSKSSSIARNINAAKYKSPRKTQYHVKMSTKLDDNFNLYDNNLNENENVEEVSGENLEEGMKVTYDSQKSNIPVKPKQPNQPKSLLDNKAQPSVRKPKPPATKPTNNRKGNRKDHQTTDKLIGQSVQGLLGPTNHSKDLDHNNDKNSDSVSNVQLEDSESIKDNKKKEKIETSSKSSDDEKELNLTESDDFISDSDNANESSKNDDNDVKEENGIHSGKEEIEDVLDEVMLMVKMKISKLKIVIVKKKKILKRKKAKAPAMMKRKMILKRKKAEVPAIVKKKIRTKILLKVRMKKKVRVLVIVLVKEMSIRKIIRVQMIVIVKK